MIIIDTNVVSEPLKRDADSRVLTWLDNQSAETLFLTAISLSELLIGIKVLPKGRRKENLSDALSELIDTLFAERILPFDREAAIAYASIVARARRAGKTVSIADAQIAAIATVHGFSVATRDTAPFAALAVRTINPWGKL